MLNHEIGRGPLRSSLMTEGVDRATHRSLFYAMGWEQDDLRKPLVAVVNSFNSWCPATYTSSRSARRSSWASPRPGVRRSSFRRSPSATAWPPVMPG